MTTLLKYEESRRQSVIRMIAEFFAEHFSISESEKAEVTPERLKSAEEDLGDWLEKDSAVLFVIEENGEEAGVMLLARHGGSVVWIENLYVKPAYRRRGIATRAIRFAEQYAADVMKAPAVNLDVIPQNTDAIRLYHSLGYDTLQMITLRKHFGDERREKPVELLGYEFKI